MNTNTTERYYPSEQPSAFRHIDLTRHLPSLRSSLSPAAPKDPRPPHQQDGDEFAEQASRMFMLFVILIGILIAAYLASYPAQ